MHLELYPAYGRNYKTSHEAITAFEENKDFLDLKSKSYCNLEDCLKYNINYVEIYYNRDKNKTKCYPKYLNQKEK